MIPTMLTMLILIIPIILIITSRMIIIFLIQVQPNNLQKTTITLELLVETVGIPKVTPAPGQTTVTLVEVHYCMLTCIRLWLGNSQLLVERTTRTMPRASTPTRALLLQSMCYPNKDVIDYSMHLGGSFPNLLQYASRRCVCFLQPLFCVLSQHQRSVSCADWWGGQKCQKHKRQEDDDMAMKRPCLSRLLTRASGGREVDSRRDADYYCIETRCP